MQTNYLDTLRECLSAHGDATAGQGLRQLVEMRLDCLPLPGHGQTLLRWQSLALVAEHNLSLSKLFEGHSDALAILAELNADVFVPERSRWGVWAAEPPGVKPQLTEFIPGGHLLLSGRKSWCSGADSLSHALVTAWQGGRGPFLVAVELDQPGVFVTREGWSAVGMAASGSVDVVFENARVDLIGSCSSYLDRPGFWYGGAGIAACWYGGAVGLARRLFKKASGQSNPYTGAALGAVDAALEQVGALLRSAAGSIDLEPAKDARLLALRCRAAAEAAATMVLHEVGRAMGAAPYCRDAWFARQSADLPVFLRQSHGEQDLAALGAGIVEAGRLAWQL